MVVHEFSRSSNFKELTLLRLTHSYCVLVLYVFDNGPCCVLRVQLENEDLGT